MAIKDLIETIESVIDETVAKEKNIVETEVLSEGPVYRDVVRSVLGLVTENSPPGCTGSEFGQGLSFALLETLEESGLDRDEMHISAVEYLTDVICALEEVYYNETVTEDSADEQ